MGLLDKVKNMFIEEVEEEEPIKKEVIQVKIPSPKIEKVEEVVEKEETIEPKKEEKFVFPVYFDDKDFEKIEKVEPKEEKVVPIKPIVTPKREAYGVKKEEKAEKKIFKPTPIISPVYGVLDKNYHKDDISSKKKPKTIEYRDNNIVDIDDVRRKAYGTLEDELENTLFEKTSILFNEEVENNEVEADYSIIDIFDEKPRHEQRDEFEINNNLNELEEIDNMIEDELNKPYEESDNSGYVDELNDSELFNLIDSMYEKKEDE